MIFIFFVTSLGLSAQKLKVIELESRLPIKGVSISNKDRSIVFYTNSSGFVDISKFDKKRPVFIYHYSYAKKKVFINDLIQNNFLVELKKNTENLDEIILSVSKIKEKKNRIAEQIETFTAREIKTISSQTSAELLSKSPGIKVQKSQLGGGSPVLRGMEANRILLVIDGVRMNNAIYRKGHLQNSITVSPSFLERVEILFGPSSVIYGSDALGGVIHYYTKTLNTSEYGETNSSIFSRISSVNNEITTLFDTELSFKKWSSYTSISRSSFGDLKMGNKRNHGFDNWGKIFEYSKNSKNVYNEKPLVNLSPNIQRNTGYSQLDFLQKIYFPISNTTELSANFQYSKSSNIPRFDKLTETTDDGKLKFAEWFYGPQKRLLFSTQLKFNEINNYIEEGVITVSYQDIDESRVQRKFGSLKKYYREENVKVIGLNGDFSMILSGNKNKNLSYGFEVIYNKIASNAHGENLELNTSKTNIVGVRNNFNVQSRYPDGGSNYFSQAAYISYRQDLNNKHTMNTGIRFTNTQLNSTWIDQSFIELPDLKISLKNSSLTATMGHIYRPNKSFKISAVLSSGFRSPNIDDIGKIREKRGTVTVPNLHLKPEYVYNSEIGILKFFNNNHLSIGINLYYTFLHNYIVKAPFQLKGRSTITYDGEENLPIFANVNRGNAFIKGGTFSFKGEIIENWFTKGAITFTKGKTYDTKEPLSSIPPVFGNLLVGYGKDKIEVSFDYEFNLAKRTKNYNLSEGIDNIEQTPIVDENATSYIDKYAGTPRWSILNFSIGYEFSQNIDLQFKVDNIFDIHYREFASGISAPGRNFSSSIRYMF